MKRIKRIDNKGFMLAEIIIVSTTLAIALVGLFTTYSRVFLEYEKRSEYESIDALYFARGISKHYWEKFKFKHDEGDLHYKDITAISNNDEELKAFFKKYMVFKSYIVRYEYDSLENLKSSSGIKDGLERYLEYLLNNLDFNDKSCAFIIITELTDNCKDEAGTWECDEDNANIKFGYYKVN